MTDHPDALEFIAFARGRLGQPRADQVLEHCRSCDECGNQLAAVLLLRGARDRLSDADQTLFGLRPDDTEDS